LYESVHEVDQLENSGHEAKTDEERIVKSKIVVSVGVVTFMPPPFVGLTYKININLTL
jgi:hypothetical protein